ncbi:hypothetical protein F443_10272 [Phytophthora nicotianae P1569]|uniref:Uncharacterized protein n=1 Tax=Phytophthora nicotianae P1569 TaxID=1317065 RepID=V9F3Z4_PHYNI|nr:hypothetical protein F443_10272 [Phytophthora nicotianae P1569]
MAIAAYVIFPIPFSVLTMTPVYNILYIVAFRLVMGTDVIRRTKAQPEQFKRYMNNLHAQILMMFVYPIYEVLFRTAQGSHYQLFVILLLPIIKVVIKNIMRKCTMHAEDMVPEAVIFTVDFFNAIYVATCMQTASSAVSIVIIVLTDLSQTIIMLYGLHRRTAVISSALTQTVQKPHKDQFLSVLCELCRNPEIFKKQLRAGITLRSCFSYDLSVADVSLLDTLDVTMKDVDTVFKRPTNSAAIVPYPTTSDIPTNHKPRWFCFRIGIGSVHPTTDVVDLTTRVFTDKRRPTRSRKPIRRKTAEHPTFLRDSLEALFSTECLVLTSYLESVIPMFYTTYILVMVHLPSSKYHTEMVGITAENVGARISPVFMFGLLQIASLLLLLVTIKRNCLMRALYQLAFVLESQKLLVQTKLIVWMMITLCFRVMHFGVDFTFKFSGFGYKISSSSPGWP